MSQMTPMTNRNGPIPSVHQMMIPTTPVAPAMPSDSAMLPKLQ